MTFVKPKTWLVGLSIILMTGGAWAQNYPSRPVTLIVPSTPGLLDTVGRTLASLLSVQLKQPFVIENKPGGGGYVGAAIVARAPANGYTLLFMNASTIYSDAFFANQSPVLSRDLLPIATVGEAPFYLVTSATMPAKTLAEFIALVKANPGKYNMAYFPVSTVYLDSMAFLKAQGMEMVGVPYNGATELVRAMVTGDVHLGVLNLGTVKAMIDAGRVVALASAGRTRSEQMPATPTAQELGYDSVISIGYWLLGPDKLPRDIVALLNRETRVATLSQGFKGVLNTAGLSPAPATPEELRQQLSSNAGRYARIAAEVGIQKQ
jgi:tripartite-type tricarboxylate transporter receptor subunit TctC